MKKVNPITKTIEVESLDSEELVKKVKELETSLKEMTKKYNLAVDKDYLKKARETIDNLMEKVAELTAENESLKKSIGINGKSEDIIRNLRTQIARLKKEKAQLHETLLQKPIPVSKRLDIYRNRVYNLEDRDTKLIQENALLKRENALLKDSIEALTKGRKRSVTCYLNSLGKNGTIPSTELKYYLDMLIAYKLVCNDEIMDKIHAIQDYQKEIGHTITRAFNLIAELQSALVFLAKKRGINVQSSTEVMAFIKKYKRIAKEPDIYSSQSFTDGSGSLPQVSLDTLSDTVLDVYYYLYGRELDDSVLGDLSDIRRKGTLDSYIKRIQEEL